MINIRHYGIYVSDIEAMESFYKEVFDMRYICRQERCYGNEFDLLTGEKNVCVLMTKLITERGEMTGSGDMIELLQIVSQKKETKLLGKRLSEPGTIHIAIECDFGKTLQQVEIYQGKIVIKPMVMASGNLMCFITDPEGNYIELIERRNGIDKNHNQQK